MMIKHFELGMVLVGLDPDNDDDYSEAENWLDDRLNEKYGFDDMAGFQQLIDELLPMIDVGRSSLTKTVYKGFAKEFVFLSKLKVEEEE